MEELKRSVQEKPSERLLFTLILCVVGLFMLWLTFGPLLFLLRKVNDQTTFVIVALRFTIPFITGLAGFMLVGFGMYFIVITKPEK